MSPREQYIILVPQKHTCPVAESLLDVDCARRKKYPAALHNIVDQFQGDISKDGRSQGGCRRNRHSPHIVPRHAFAEYTCAQRRSIRQCEVVKSAEAMST